MSCKHCDFTGVNHGTQIYNGQVYPFVIMCKHCKDKNAYIQYVKNSMATRLTQEELINDTKLSKEKSIIKQRHLKIIKNEDI